MNLPILIYCYDAYCGWCYGYSNVINKIEEIYKKKLQFEVLSGGMIIYNATPKPISIIAPYILEAYQIIEATTRIKFGEDFLWHIHHSNQSDWFPDSLKPAIALCIFKEYYPDKQIEFASKLQHALYFEGRDLCDKEAYRHLLEEYSIDTIDFYEKMREERYKQAAFQEFDLCKKLQVNGFPTLLIQLPNSTIHLISRGYMDYETIKNKIDTILTY